MNRQRASERGNGAWRRTSAWFDLQERVFRGGDWGTRALKCGRARDNIDAPRWRPCGSSAARPSATYMSAGSACVRLAGRGRGTSPPRSGAGGWGWGWDWRARVTSMRHWRRCASRLEAAWATYVSMCARRRGGARPRWRTTHPRTCTPAHTRLRPHLRTRSAAHAPTASPVCCLAIQPGKDNYLLCINTLESGSVSPLPAHAAELRMQLSAVTGCPIASKDTSTSAVMMERPLAT
jgi:hypothetical protein